ncbi:stage III sporulation protein AH [Proteinivorax hydrogeniformans]|uniref:Stage III sporulation protein AH n=1 Tax=Proteinivorax hydrogeniformans TaxID=1826727 RepID=A0AAU8HVB0_9FIRM
MVHIVVIEIKNPTGLVYKELLKVSFKVCDTFLLVVRKGMSKNPSINIVLEELKPFHIKIKDQSRWPGTTVYSEEPAATVYYYRTESDALDILTQSSDSLYKWLQPYLPEDLSFLKEGKEWLINTSHEKDCVIITNDKEDIDKVLKIKGLQHSLRIIK